MWKALIGKKQVECVLDKNEESDEMDECLYEAQVAREGVGGFLRYEEWN